VNATFADALRWRTTIHFTSIECGSTLMFMTHPSRLVASMLDVYFNYSKDADDLAAVMLHFPQSQFIFSTKARFPAKKQNFWDDVYHLMI
jgi:hypothetical protein